VPQPNSASSRKIEVSERGFHEEKVPADASTGQQYLTFGGKAVRAGHVLLYGEMIREKSLRVSTGQMRTIEKELAADASPSEIDARCGGEPVVEFKVPGGLEPSGAQAGERSIQRG